MKQIVFLLLLMVAQGAISQDITGDQLLDRAIQYHDPSGQWPTFKGRLRVVMETPSSPNRDSDISIDLPAETFKLTAQRGDVTTEYELVGDQCSLKLNGSEEFDPKEAEEAGLSCERGSMYKNYYTYLYGLPMKLKDPGTNLDPEVKKMSFKGKEYLVLNVTYDQEVGSDVWRFYFDPETYALEVYQFFKGDPDGAGKNTGEYILLDGTKMVEGMKIPKTRAWYYNKDDKYLGTDILQ